jgi:carbon monoxide dehydrogenase subunit G
MLKLQSKTVVVNKTAPALFDYVNDLPNLKAVMPESVERFEADAETFLFGLKGMPDVRLIKHETERPKFLRFKSASSKLDFMLTAQIKDLGETSELHFEFEGNFNAMMKMMVERPLKNFIEDLAANAAKL